MKKLILAFGAALFMASCSSLPSIGSIAKVGTAQVSINNSSWVLAESTKGKAPTLIINNDKITGNAPCNQYFGQLTLDPKSGNFSAKHIGATRMSCDNLDSENNYLNMLQQVDKYVVTDRTLELYKGNLLLLKFNRQ